MVSPILEGIVVTCHIKRAVFNRHLITYEVWGGGGDAVVVVVVVVLVIVAVDIVELDVDGELLNFFFGSDSDTNVTPILVGTFELRVSFIFWYYLRCFGHLAFCDPLGKLDHLFSPKNESNRFETNQTESSVSPK